MRRVFFVRKTRARKPARKTRKTARRVNYLKHKESARELVIARIAHWNQLYHFKPGRISIKNTRTRWGSCSKKGNLNFNYRIVLLPERLADYIVVHELCHLGEFNHSQKFWALVARAMPDYKALRAELKRDGVRCQ